jgi:hypothetical protein
MRETPEDLHHLQALLDRGIAQAGSFLRASFGMPDHSLSALQLARYLQGSHTVALATVTAGGEPRVAPISALFYRGHFHVPTVTTAVRAQHVLKRPAVSLTHYRGSELAIIAHGRASLVAPGAADFAVLEELQCESGNQSVLDWGEGVYMRIDADVLYTYARDPAVLSANEAL